MDHVLILPLPPGTRKSDHVPVEERLCTRERQTAAVQSPTPEHEMAINFALSEVVARALVMESYCYGAILPRIVSLEGRGSQCAIGRHLLYILWVVCQSA